MVTALEEDSEGGLWIGSFNGVSRMKDGKVTNLKDHLKLPGPAVQAILEDAAGALWFGTNAGLARRRDGAVTAYTTKDGLAGDDVRAILEDRQGHLWIGTYSGVTRIADGKFSSWTKREGMKSNRVRALHEDRSGAIWVGAYDGGLSRIKDGKVANITMDDGLFNNGVFRILEDARGNFWMICNLGIYRVSRQQLDDFADGKIRAVNSIVYGKSDGMLNPECNGGYQPAGIRARDGKLWFPTQQGVAVIDPENVPSNPRPPPVVIEECLLDRAPLDFDEQAQIAPSQRNLEIHYSEDKARNVEAQRQMKFSLTGGNPALAVKGDFDGDGRTDLAVWRGAYGQWFIPRSSVGDLVVVNWGLQSAPYFDIAAPGDYDGDGKTDPTVYRRSTGEWYVKRSSDSAQYLKRFGVGTDIPAPGDYDGDGKTDIAVWRTDQTGQWELKLSGDGSLFKYNCGYADDTPVPTVGVR